MNTDAHQRIAIEGELSIYTVTEWKLRLDDLLGQGGSLELDLGAVQELDTAGLQLLIMVKKEVITRNQHLRLSNHSQAVLEAFKLCDIANYFGDPILLSRLLSEESPQNSSTERQGTFPVEPEGDGQSRDDTLEAHHWHISLRLGRDLLRNGMDPLAFIRYLATLGYICNIVTLSDNLPPWTEMDPESCYLGFEIGFHTNADQTTIEGVFEFIREDSQVHILAPHDKTDEYRKMIQALPQEYQRMSEILLMRCGIPPVEEALKNQPVKDSRKSESSLIRVDAAKLDQLINLIGELIIAGAGANLAARNAGVRELVEATAILSRLVEEVRHSALTLRTPSRKLSSTDKSPACR